MDKVDSYIPTPKRETEKEFLMAVEDVFSITGRAVPECSLERTEFTPFRFYLVAEMQHIYCC